MAPHCRRQSIPKRPSGVVPRPPTRLRTHVCSVWRVPALRRRVAGSMHSQVGWHAACTWAFLVHTTSTPSYIVSSLLMADSDVFEPPYGESRPRSRRGVVSWETGKPVTLMIPDGLLIIPVQEATVSDETLQWDTCIKIRWKDQEFLCEPTPSEIIDEFAAEKHTYEIAQMRTRYITPVPHFEFPIHRQPMLLDSPTDDDVNNYPMLRAWCLSLIATLVDDDDVFRCNGHGKCYTLTPPTPSPVPLQRMHIGPGAIPTELADRPCGTVADALRELNDIMDTTHSLEATDGLHDFLASLIAESRDFGELYGRVRLWWYQDATYADSRAYFEEVAQRMHTRKKNDDRDRSDIIQHNSYIKSDSHPPPRRVWDLFSNRVLPYYVIRDTDALKDDLSVLDAKLWTVSHSWVADAEREDLWTDVNGRQWPVPVPRATTLEHVRVELLNMGAEYVWLDVLCLRQRGRDEDEPRRLDEWRIDVPTIGFVYQGNPTSRYCITYLNGLGLPCIADPAVVASDRHWFNRVWTIQEALESRWLPGGLTPASAAARSPTDHVSFWCDVEFVARNLVQMQENGFSAMFAGRHCTTELDRVAVLGYCLHKKCRSIPVYDIGMSAEQAWTELLKHLPPDLRTAVFVYGRRTKPFALWVPISDFLDRTSRWEYASCRGAAQLRLTDQLGPGSEDYYSKQLALRGPARYGHLVTTVGPYYVTCHRGYTAENTTVSFCASGLSKPLALVVQCSVEGAVLPDVLYTLLYMHLEDRREYEEPQGCLIVTEAAETGQELQGRPILRAIRCAIIKFRFGQHYSNPMSAHDTRKAYVIYMDEDEARQRCAHTERYEEAYERMQEHERTLGEEENAFWTDSASDRSAVYEDSDFEPRESFEHDTELRAWQDQDRDMSRGEAGMLEGVRAHDTGGDPATSPREQPRPLHLEHGLHEDTGPERTQGPSDEPCGRGKEAPEDTLASGREGALGDAASHGRHPADTPPGIQLSPIGHVEHSDVHRQTGAVESTSKSHLRRTFSSLVSLLTCR